MGTRAATWTAAAAAALLFLPSLDAPDLWAPDEPRYAAVAENIRSGVHGATGLVLLHVNDEVYTQKPPLYFWLAALAGLPGHRVDERAARLPSALAGVGAAALTARLGAAALGPVTGALGGVLFATTAEVAWRSRRAQLDVLLAFFELGALLAFWRIAGRPGRTRTAAPGVVEMLWLHGMLGLATLTKGPVGFALPALSFAAFLALEGRARELRALFAPRWLAVSLGPALLWIAAATALAPPGYFDAAVTDNLLGRFFGGSSHPRPFYYYAYQFPLELLPWTLLAPLVWRAARRRVFAPHAEADRARAWRLLLTWIGTALVFFSLSAGKRGLYMLPVFPATALLIADAVVIGVGHRRDLPRAAGRAAAALAALLALSGPSAALFAASRGVELPLPAILAPGVVALLGTLAWRAASRLPRPAAGRVAALVGAVLVAELAILLTALPPLDAEKSPRPVAASATAAASPGAGVGLLGRPTLVGGLDYYGDRRIEVVESPEALRSFIDAGGRIVVVPARHLQRVLRVTPVEVRARHRTGRRTLLVVEVQGSNAEREAPPDD